MGAIQINSSGSPYEQKLDVVPYYCKALWSHLNETTALTVWCQRRIAVKKKIKQIPASIFATV